MKKRLIIIIPARSGSTSIKNKNMKKINGKPLLYYTCNFAKKLKNKENVIIGCTDKKKIQNYFNSQKILSPFLRPANISKKFSLDIEYINYSLNFFSQKNIYFLAGLILRPTSPIRFISDYLSAKRKFFKIKDASSLRSVIKSPITPYKMWFKSGNKLKSIMTSNNKEHYNMPRQKLKKTFWQTGTFDFFKVDYKKKINSISGRKIICYELKNKFNIDVDTSKDYTVLRNYLKK
tara:strand:- start:4405 stop:5106 length:702 start_codon:yes stop_codon:yes gene_type:complete